MALQQHTFTLAEVRHLPLENDIITDSILEDTGASAIDFTRGWAIEFITDGIDGMPTYTVEGKIHGEFKPIHISSTNIPLTDVVQGDFFHMLDMRLRIKRNDNTIGTAIAKLTMK